MLDGQAGTLEVEPAADVVAEREAAREAGERRRAETRAHAREPATTTDGHTLEVAANLGSPAEAAEAVELGADGVGLLRTEFLFLDRDTAPTEDEQRAVYEEIARALGGRPLIVRTLDAGADKPLRFLRQAPEENPFLGVRGIRLGLAQPELLRTQLRAILAVAAEHPVRVMFPMVSTLAEYRAARRDRGGARRPADRRRDHGRGPGRGGRGRALRARGRLLLGRHERPRPVHDGRRARQRGAGAAAERPAARAAAPDRHADGRGASSTAAGSACAASWPATRRRRSCSPASASPS